MQRGHAGGRLAPRSALLLSPVQASVAELVLRTIAEDDGHEFRARAREAALPLRHA
jgi:hypothetical protein